MDCPVCEWGVCGLYFSVGSSSFVSGRDVLNDKRKHTLAKYVNYFSFHLPTTYLVERLNLSFITTSSCVSCLRVV